MICGTICDFQCFQQVICNLKGIKNYNCSNVIKEEYNDDRFDLCVVAHRNDDIHATFLLI